MANEVQPQKSFQERMKDRVKESIGDLLTDEELSKIVENGVHETFFEPRKVMQNYSRTEFKEPLIVEILHDLLEDQVKRQVRQWLEDNPDAVREAMHTVVEKGMAQAMFNVIQNTFRSDIESFVMNVENRLQNGGL